MNSKRIKWIDYAKGISIILMVVAHSLDVKDFLRMFIFSFHMPLFLILSGYNIKRANNIKELFYMIYKDFKGLIIPYILAIIICCIVKYWDFGITFVIRNIFFSIIWGNGLDNYTFYWLYEVFPICGPFWFLICLFWGKVIVRLIDYWFKGKIKIIIYSLLIFLGLKFGADDWLVFSFDLSLVSLLFLKLGQYYKSKEQIFNKYSKIICIICFIIWCVCLANKLYIELAIRYYAIYGIGIIESICGSFCIICLCKWLEKFKLNILSYIGKISLIILIVHSLEYILIDYSILIKMIDINLFIILKTVMVLFISVLFDFSLNKVRKLKLYEKVF